MKSLHLLLGAASAALALALPAPTAWGADGPAADLILHNATVWTVDDKNPTAQAVAVKDGKLLAVGGNEAALRHRGKGTQLIDLGGRFVLPGFIDSHVHFAA